MQYQEIAYNEGSAHGSRHLDMESRIILDFDGDNKKPGNPALESLT